MENKVNARRDLFKESIKPLQRRKKVSVLEATKTSTKRTELELRDVLEVMSRDDLNRIGLKKGPELRIWQKVERYRRESILTHVTTEIRENCDYEGYIQKATKFD